MAIFGKKKDKNAAQQDSSANYGTASPTNTDVGAFGGPNNGNTSRSPPAAGPSSRDGHQGMSHGQKSSHTGSSGAAGMASAYGSMNGMQPSGILRAAPAPPSNFNQQQQQFQNGSANTSKEIGPPGAAGGFKFGGPAPRPDGSGFSGIPAPGSQVRAPANRSKKISNDPESTLSQQQQSGIPSTSSGLPGQQQPQGSGIMPPSGSGITGLPSSSTQGLPVQQGGTASGDRVKTQQVVYPWSQRILTMNPPKFLDETRQVPAGALSPSPFPRYGHAANAFASSAGEVYLFGGLVRESVKNDLYVVHVDKVLQPPVTPLVNGGLPPSGGVNATLVQTSGEIPPPRVGHATVLVANVLILWGGDTKVRADDKQDEGLYLLNLSTREWTRVRHSGDNPNAGPVGRYGHTVSIIGSRFFVFGGQVDGTFMNDLWTFDLNSLKSTPTWEILKPTSEMPPRRTGHASITCRDKIYIFGGTDGQYHYNDTWCYDVATNSWKELSCIGYIPVPREGHAACLVDDVMYIFGGRGVDGKDLGDLASFRISNQRWYMFANMGPSPSGRSGHALTTYQNKVVVLGGESFTGGKADDPTFVHVLDTGKIKYPAEGVTKSPSSNIASLGRKSGIPMANEANRATSVSPTKRAISPTQRGAGNTTSGPQSESLVGMMQKSTDQPMTSSQDSPASKLNRSAGAGNNTCDSVNRSMSPSNASRNVPVTQAPLNATTAAIPPASPPPAQSTSLPQVSQGSRSANNVGGSGIAATAPAAYTGPKSQRSIENLRNGSVSPPNGLMYRNKNGIVAGADAGAAAGAMGYGSDRGSTVASPTAPDGFHYGTLNQQNGMRAIPALQSNTNPAELEMLRKREAWMRAALAMAVKKGFVMPEQPDSIEVGDISTTSTRHSMINLSLDDVDTGSEGSDKERVLRAVIALKGQLASAKSMIAQQAAGEADRIAEADRARAAALSEATFYKAKLEALENGNMTEADRLQRSKNVDVERQLAVTLRECGDLERQLSRAKEELKFEQQMKASVEDRLGETSKRAIAAEESQMKLHEQLATLQKTSYHYESQLRDHKEKVASLNSLVITHQGNHQQAQRQVEEYRSTSTNHQAALQGLQASLAAITARATEHEQLHYQHRDLVQQHESTIASLRNELSAKSNAIDQHVNRAAELESLVGRHRDEAESHRIALNNGLAQVLLHQQQQQQQTRSVDAEDAPLHIQEQMRALEEERESLRQLHLQSKDTADSANSLLQEVRDRNYSLEKQHVGLKNELSAMKSQLSIALQEVARIKDHSNSKDDLLRDAKRNIESTQVRHGLMRQMMVDRGMAVPNDQDLNTLENSNSTKKIKELERQIDQQSRQLQETEERLQDASSRVEELTRELEHGKSRSREAFQSGDDMMAAQRRAEEAERQVMETSNTYKERMSQLENDYQTAVQFVKGSEKMLRRMKDELTKYKTENTSLQSEVISLRSGNAIGSSDTEAIRDVEALRMRLAELTQENETTNAEKRKLEKKMSLLISDQKDNLDRSRSHANEGVDSNEGTKRAKELEVQVDQLEGNLQSVRRELQETLALNTHLNNELNSATKSNNHINGSGQGGSLAKDLSNAQHQNEQLKTEKESLGQKLQEAEDKLQLLLGRIEGNESEGNMARDSRTFSISSELDKWERDRATDGGAVYGSNLNIE